MTIEGKIDTHEEIVEILSNAGFNCTLNENKDGILLAIESRKSYMAEMAIINGMLVINCEIGKIIDIAPDQTMHGSIIVSALKLNAVINPFALTVFEPENVTNDDEVKSIDDFNLIVTDMAPVADMDPSETIAMVNSLNTAIRLIETDLLEAYGYQGFPETSTDIDIDDIIKCEFEEISPAIENVELLSTLEIN